MSWMKGAPGGAPPPGRDRQAYGAPQPQPFGNQQNMYSNFQGGVVPANQQQQYWQVAQQGQPQQQHPYNQQYGQVYQQDYAANANQFYQQPNQFNQNYTNQDYTGAQQTNSYPQEYHQNQVQHQNFNQQPKVDGWDNWDWGWEDSNKQGQKPQQNATQPQAMIQQQPTVNNANVIEESFGATDTWTWAMDDKKNAISHPEPHSTGLPQTTQEPQMLPVSNANPVIENNSVPDVNAPKNSNNLSSQHVEEVRTLNDKDVVKEHLPNLALGKRFNLENLTPQWSIESQMSQESSDGPHTHSEGTHRTQSRNSNKSSPGINTDNSNFNFSQSGIEDGYTPSNEWSRPSDEVTLVESLQGSSRRESHDELSNSLQEMNLNHENHSTSNKQVVQESVVRTVPENIVQPPLSISPGSFPPPVSSSLPPPPMSAAMPPPPPVSSGTLPPASSSSALPGPPPSMSAPPPNIAPMSNQNPFKHAGPFSHKTLSKGPSPNQSTVQSLPPQIPSTNLSAPAVVNKVSQHNRVPIGFEANLETTPDNSERPDQPQLSAFRPMSVQQHVPDNMEVAPRNDRNEYLQTAHLSGGDYNENTDFSRNAPPPGLRRMVVGQQESEYGQSLNISGDEPPPGLARMVPGQQTEAEVIYNQSSDDYMDRHIDGQPTDSGVRPYRQADGQQTPDYPQPAPGRGSDRRPIGLDRMVPGEPSNNEYPQYANSSYGGPNDQRVVMGVDHDYPIPTDAGPSDVREQNVDGSDYSEPSSRNPPRNVIGARESSNDVSPDYSAPLDEQQRELTMEGENLQDLSVISSVDLAYSRDQTLDGADLTLADIATDRKTDLSDSIDLPAAGSRRQSLNRVNTSGEDSERDRAFKASPRRDRDKHKSAKNRDRDRDRERDREKDRDRDRDRERDKEGRYSRGKYERDDRRVGRDDRRDKERRDRRDRDDSPEARRARRAARSSRPPADDTDYYSDRERDRRHRREGSYTSSKPPRPDDHRDRDRDRDRKRYTVERDRRYDDDRDRRRSDKYRDRYERSYRDIDPTRKYGNLRRPRDKDDRRVVTFSRDAKTNDSCTNEGEFSSPSRPGSGEHTATDDDGEPRRRDRRPRHARTAEPFYDEYADPYAAQRRQYEYYEHLRLTNPAAYMQVYKQLLAGRAPPVPPTYGDEYLGYGVREERGSVHSGRSSTTGLKGNDTYFGYRHDAASLRDAPSLRTDLSDRDLNTDMSLNLHLEDSTVRSERMTPFRFSTAHIKGSISSRDVVVVRPSYPVDGAPATVQLLSLAQALAHDPDAAELTAFPGPLVNGVTHKKSVMDYCAWRARRAPLEATCDVRGYGLLWTLLALLLRQNGVVVGSDIAELLMKNTQEDEEAAVTPKPHDERRGSSASDSGREEPATAVDTPQSESATVVAESEDPRVALDRLREYLIYGNRQEALEWAMSHQLWGHALHLSAYGDRRTRALVSSRFVSALPRTDPLHTLYTALAGNIPPAVTGVSDERWGDWRPHAAMLLANAGARPEHDSRAVTQLGDSLLSRGLLYSAQFCFVSAGRAFERHPLAPLAPPGPQGPCSPPRLALLLADSRSHSLREFASNRAIFATEVYEYALSLRQDHYVIPELQVYKLLLATRLVDCGQYERALAYAEAAARAVTQQPRLYEPALAMRLADLADRLKFHDPALQAEPVPDEGDSPGDSPRHQQWIDDVRNTAHALAAESAQASQQVTPLHQATPPQPHVDYYASQQYGWTEQAQQYQPPPPAEPTEETPDYAQQYYAQAPAPPVLAPGGPPAAPEPEPQPYPAYGEEWPRNDDYASSYADPYWNGDHAYGYGEAGEGEVGAAAAPRPAISMPGATSGAYHHEDRPPSATDQTDRETDTPKQSGKAESKGKDEAKAKAEGRGKGGGWLGGILTKLSLRPPNQMILPDDKNPTIVWDAEHKRWRNVDGDADEPEPPPPPPRLQDLQPPQSASPPLATPAMGAPPSAPVSNIFKMQKSRHIKKSYVDVFNPSGAATRPLPPASEVLGPPAPSAGAAPALFVPQPMPTQSTSVAIPGSVPPTPSPRDPSLPPSTPRLLPHDEQTEYGGGQADGDFRSGI